MPVPTGGWPFQALQEPAVFPPGGVCQLWALAEEQGLAKVNVHLWGHETPAKLWQSRSLTTGVFQGIGHRVVFLSRHLLNFEWKGTL